MKNPIDWVENKLDRAFSGTNWLVKQVWVSGAMVDLRREGKSALARIGDEIFTNIVDGVHQAFGQKTNGEVWVFRDKPGKTKTASSAAVIDFSSSDQPNPLVAWTERKLDKAFSVANWLFSKPEKTAPSVEAKPAVSQTPAGPELEIFPIEECPPPDSCHRLEEIMGRAKAASASHGVPSKAASL